jgi:hypothetical protein
VLGYPVEERWLDAQKFSGGILTKGGDGQQYAVAGILLSTWEKNKKYDGPLGAPASDSVITTKIIDTGSFPMQVTQTAVQTFQGAKIDYSLFRVIVLGEPAWKVVEVYPKNSGRALLQAEGWMGQDGPNNDGFELHGQVWVHPGRTSELRFFDNDSIELYSGVVLTPTAEIQVKRSGANIRVNRVRWGYRHKPTAGDAYILEAPQLGALTVAPNSEETYDVDHKLGDTFKGFVECDFVTVTHLPVKAGDIKF